MKATHALRKQILGFFGLLVLLPYAHLAWGASCKDVVEERDRTLNIMTINLLFSEKDERDARLGAIADFAADKADQGEPVDVFLLQEATGGVLVGTENSAEDLQDLLQEAGQERGLDLDYELRTAFEAGLPGVVATANAVLSRCDISLKLVRFLPLTSESVQLGDLDIPITRNVMIVRLKIPGFGKMNVYNTHLCASECNEDDGLEKQVRAVLDFVRKTERILSFGGRRPHPHVLGGDFNLDRFRTDNERALYNVITDDKDFVDGYAEGQEKNNDLELEDLCPSDSIDFGDLHCTVEVSDFDRNEEGELGTPRRIDYIFTKRVDIEQSSVEFNPCARLGFIPDNNKDGTPQRCDEKLEKESLENSTSSVSDHAGVLVTVTLP